MSKEKVERYKEYKKNKAQILKKEKRNRKLAVVIAALVAVVFIGWFGWSIYHRITNPPVDETAQGQTAEVTTVNFTAFDDFYNGIKQSFSDLEE